MHYTFYIYPCWLQNMIYSEHKNGNNFGHTWNFRRLKIKNSGHSGGHLEL
jgi:hypothetical protein